MNDPPEGDVKIWAADNEGELRKYKLTLDQLYDETLDLEDYRVSDF